MHNGGETRSRRIGWRGGEEFAASIYKEMSVLEEVSHRPYPMPSRPWRMAQRWTDLLFAHWPIAPELLEGRLPAGVEADLFDGQAWLGVVPFTMSQVRVRIEGSATISVPTARRFPELNLRTYVRSRQTGRRGVYFFSLDAGSALAVLGARVLFHLPYFPARMSATHVEGGVGYRSRRWLPRNRPAAVEVQYRPTGPVELSQLGDLPSFLTERYCLFTTDRQNRLRVGEIHHRPWPLQRATAEFRRNDLATDFGFALPPAPPVLHFARELDVYIWALRSEDAPG